MNIILENIRYVKFDEEGNTVEVGRPTSDELGGLHDLVDDALHAERAVERFSGYANGVTDGKAVAVVWDLRVA